MHWVIDYLFLCFLMSFPEILFAYFAKQMVVDIYLVLIHGVDHEQQTY